MAYYRNKSTDKIQWHPKSGLGDVFNSVEIEETGRPVKPRLPLGSSRSDLREAQNLLDDKSGTPNAPAPKRKRSTKAAAKAAPSAPAANPGVGTAIE